MKKFCFSVVLFFLFVSFVNGKALTLAEGKNNYKAFLVADDEIFDEEPEEEIMTDDDNTEYGDEDDFFDDGMEDDGSEGEDASSNPSTADIPIALIAVIAIGSLCFAIKKFNNVYSN